MTLGRLYLLGFVLYGVLVGGVTYYEGSRPGVGPHTRLVHAVAENEWIEDADLASLDQPDIAQHYARRQMAKGEPITPDDVAAKPHPAPKPSLAVLTSYARETRPKPLAAGDRARLCLDGAALTPAPLDVTAVTCDATTCTATLTLPNFPKPLLDEGAAARLRLADDSTGCDSK